MVAMIGDLRQRLISWKGLKRLNAKQKGHIFYNNMEQIVPDFMSDKT